MIGSRLKDLRTKGNYSQNALGKLINTDARRIWLWESEKTKPTIDKIVQLANILNTSADYLLGITDDPMPAHQRGLSPQEYAVIVAMRRGDTTEAIKEILKEQ